MNDKLKFGKTILKMTAKHIVDEMGIKDFLVPKDDRVNLL